MKNTMKASAILVFLLLFVSCATTEKKTTKNEPKIITTDAPTSLEVSSADNYNIAMKAKINFKFPSMSNSVNATIEFAGKDSIAIKLTALFGIPVGKLYANAHEFIMLNNLDNVAYTGEPTADNLMRIANLPLSYNDIVTILRTSVPHPSNEYHYTNTNTATDSSVVYNFTLSTPAETAYTENISVTKNYSSNAYSLSSLSRMQDDKNIMNVLYSNYLQIAEHNFAQKIDIRFPTLNGNVSISLSDIRLLDTLTSPMRFTPPISYKHIEL
jgi:hypothetical protein